jgi:hypothetical protein
MDDFGLNIGNVLFKDCESSLQRGQKLFSSLTIPPTRLAIGNKLSLPFYGRPSSGDAAVC